MADVPTLRTPRFTLRPLRRADAAALLPTLGDEGQCRYLTRPAFASEAELWDWLAAPDWPGLTWIAEDARGEVAGRFVAVPGHGPRVFEIGYITAIARQGEGVARECTGALIDHLLDPAGPWRARKLTADVDTRNTPSIRLLEALGFTREGTLREHDETHIGLCDVYWYGLLASERGAG
jgi:RimJ/RimL family protein N-acetyltransferase